MIDDPRHLHDPLHPLAPGEIPPAGAIPMVQTAMGLWVPARYGVADQESMTNPELQPNATVGTLRFTRLVVGWSMLTGKIAPLSEVIEHLRRYSLQEIVGLITRISIALNADPDNFNTLQTPLEDEANLRVQLRILERLAGTDFLVGAYVQMRQALEAEERWDPQRMVLFQERQTLNALKLALLVIDAGTPGQGTESRDFALALLKLSDHLDPPGGTMSREDLELYVAANLLFNESPNLLADFVRAHTIYIEPTPEVEAHGGLSLPSAVARSSSMDAEETWDALYALYSGWAVQSLHDLDVGNIINRRSHFFADLTGLSAERRDRWFDLATWNIDALVEIVRARYSLDNPRWFDVLPFEQRPLVAFGDQVFCTSLALFNRLPGRSLQHRAFDPKVMNRNEIGHLLITRGDVVEHYTLALLRRAFGDRFVGEDALRERSAGEASCDGAIIYPNAVVLVECKTLSVLLSTRHAEDYGAYREKWARAIQHAATQLATTVENIRRGSFRDLDIGPEHAREVYPVVMVFEQPLSPFTYWNLRTSVLAGHALESLMESGEVQPIQFLHIDELELWENAAETGVSVLELLRRKTQRSAYLPLPFHHFLDLENETFQHKHRRWAVERWGAIADAFEHRMRALGLPRSETADESS